MLVSDCRRVGDFGLQQDGYKGDDTFDNFLVISWDVLEVHNIANHGQDQNAKDGVISSTRNRR
jgi:hypothetical protein